MIVSILIQTSAVIIAVWLVARLATKLSVNTKAWLWRIALLKPLVCLLPFMLVPIAVLKSGESAAAIPPKASRPVSITSPLASPPARPVVEASREVPWFALWIAGSGSLALFGLASLVRTRKMAASCAPILDRDIHLAATQLCRAGGLEQTLSIAESDLVKTPMLITLGKPTLVLPSCLVRDASSEDICAIMAHEIAHFVRRDPLWTTLGWISRTVFFFNPFVWIAAHCSRVANESATDYLACQLAKISPSNYAGMLLRSTVVVRKMEPVGALHLSGPLKTMHRRLEAMKHFNNKPNIWQKLVGFTTVAAVIGLLPLYQLAEAQDKKPAAPASTPPAKPPVPVAPKAPSSVPGVPGAAPAAPIIVNRSGTSPAAAPQPGQPVAPAQAGSQSSSNSTSSTSGTSVPGSAAMPALPSGAVNIPGMPAMPASSGGGQSSSASGSASSQSSSSGNASSGGSSSSGGSNGSRSGNSSQNSQSSNNSNRSQDSQSSNSSDSSKSNSSQSSQNSQGAGVGILVPPAIAGQQRGSSGSVSANQTSDGMLFTFTFENFSYQKAIQALFDQAGKKVRFEGEILKTVSGSAKNATFEQVLNTLLVSGKLEKKMVDGVAVIRPINFGERILP